MHRMPFAIKLTTFTSLLFAVFFHITIAAEYNGISNDTTHDKNQQMVSSIYESLLSAIEMDSANEVTQFIEFGADINYRYKGGKTPLMLASSMGSIGAVRTLLGLGANINLISKESMNAIDYAREANNENILTILHANNAPKEIQSERQLLTTIQFYLNRLGYIAGDVDGIFGVKTRKSLEQFSTDFKQSFPPEISSRQIERLFNAMTMTASNSLDIADKTEKEAPPKENNAIEILATEINVDLATSETEVIKSVR